ncbi:MAG: monovalent cation:proton antiporter-2 (CPA2) family protein [Gammaproteobacteria bacterium]|nr:monovalent cation:proton antiporter-2 (CPA2) family protein [Gammaproteobacteria bacterium]MDX2486004.1 monovalent cation:proton antiporter-2 (CPA2) family protein [Gammaproteobacteria bacterium]
MTETHYLTDILILLAAAVITVPIFQRLGLGSVLGYLVAGAIVGPWGFGFIDRVSEIRHLAEFGVIFLLFIIGIELKPTRLWAMRRKVFGLGTAQVMVTGLAITGIALLFAQPLKVAIIIGFGLALSSTAFCLQILAERGELNTGYGRTAFSVLLLQDLAVVPLLALVSLLSAKTSLLEGIEFAILDAVLVIAFVIFVGRFFVSPILRLVATSRTAEVFTAASVFAVLGTAWLMEEVGLSLALGAFLAGLMMADSHYRHQVIADIKPFRGILLGLFFMGVGMSIDFGLLGSQGALIAGLALGLLLIKSMITWVLCRLMRVDTLDATRVSLLLSQSGEFGFVIFGLAATSSILPENLFHALTLLVALTMVTTPLMPKLSEYLNRYLSKPEDRHDVSTEHIDAEQPHVVIAGFGRVGRRIARILQAGNVPYLAIENNADHVLESRRDGFSVFYGDASQVDVLKAAGAGQAGALVCTLDQTIPATRLVNILRQQYPGVAIYARGHDQQHCDQLLKSGATIAISETLEASLQIGGAVLNAMGVIKDDSTTLIESFRKEYYG